MTPGSRPSDAIFRKQIRQMPNLRINARERPQIGHLLYSRTLNLALRVALILNAFLAKPSSSFLETGAALAVLRPSMRPVNS